MSGYIARLQKAGLVTRVPDEKDRRRQVLALTEEAESVLRSVRSRRTAWLAERLDSAGSRKSARPSKRRWSRSLRLLEAK